MSVRLGHLNRHVWFIPQHQFCLPKVVHTAHGHFRAPALKTTSGGALRTHFKFDNRLTALSHQSRHCVAPLIIRFTGMQLPFTSASYPEGNFGGNQLLDGSISLSPLYSSQTIDLHVRIATVLHQSFPWLRPSQA